MYGQVRACLKSFYFYKDTCTLCKGFYNVNKIDARICTGMVWAFLKNLNVTGACTLEGVVQVPVANYFKKLHSLCSLEASLEM